MELLRRRGLRYVSPAGGAAAAGVLPFRWPEVDAFHVLPVFEDKRRELLGNPEPAASRPIREHMLGAVRRVAGRAATPRWYSTTA